MKVPHQLLGIEIQVLEVDLAHCSIRVKDPENRWDPLNLRISPRHGWGAVSSNSPFLRHGTKAWIIAKMVYTFGEYVLQRKFSAMGAHK